PTSSGWFALPPTGPFLIEVSSLSANATGTYQVTLGSPATRFPANGRVTLGNGGPGLANVSMTFTRVTGSGALPDPVITDASGFWSQTGFDPGTTYRVTPSLATYDFRYPHQDFTQAATLNFPAPSTAAACDAPKSGPLAAGDCRSPYVGSGNIFADRYSFTGTAGQQIVITVTGSKGLVPQFLLIRDYDGAFWGGGSGTIVGRLPSSGWFSLPYTGAFFIEVDSLFANATRTYSVALGAPSTRFPAAGRVTSNGAAGLPNVTLTFTRVTGSGALPAPVTTDVDGYWFQTGFDPGTTYRVTPSFPSAAFTPASRDFIQATALDFSTPYTPPTTPPSTTTSSTTSTTPSTTTTTSPHTTTSTTTSTTTPTTTSTTSSTTTTRPSTTTSTTSSTTTSTRPSTTTSTTSSTTTSTTSPSTTTSSTTTSTTSSTTTSTPRS